jgi:hypothetical protein
MYRYILPEIAIVIIAVAVCNKTISGGEIASSYHNTWGSD